MNSSNLSQNTKVYNETSLTDVGSKLNSKQNKQQNFLLLNKSHKVGNTPCLLNTFFDFQSDLHRAFNISNGNSKIVEK